jgi:hypothetical protein
MDGVTRQTPNPDYFNPFSTDMEKFLEAVPQNLERQRSASVLAVHPE